MRWIAALTVMALAACEPTPLSSATNAVEAATHSLGQVKGQDVHLDHAIATNYGDGADVLLSDQPFACDSLLTPGPTMVRLQLAGLGVDQTLLPLTDGKYVVVDLPPDSTLPPGQYAIAVFDARDPQGRAVVTHVVGGVVRLKVGFEQASPQLKAEYELRFSSGEVVEGSFTARSCPSFWE